MTALACYVRAEAGGLETNKAVDLCVGAYSIAPALCFEAAVDTLNIDDSKAVQLCRGTTSNAPVACAEQLEFEQPSTQFVPYCAALVWPIVPNPAAGTAACFQAGTDDTNLTDAEVARLCRGSTDTSPVACYRAGEDQTMLDDRDLVTLCAAVMIYSPTAPVPGAS
jgi:hypothetical protein